MSYDHRLDSPDVIANIVNQSTEVFTVPSSTLYALDAIGDSMVGRQNTITTLTTSYTGTVTNNILTLTSPSVAWALHPGLLIYFMNITPDVYVTLFTVIEGTSSLVLKARANTNIPDGTLDFTTIANTSGPFLVRTFRHSDTSPVAHACARSNGALEPGYTFGFNSRASTYLPDKIHDFLDWIPNKERRMLIHWIGINDITLYSSSGTDAFNGIVANLEILKTLGYAKIIVNTIGPIDPAVYPSWTTIIRNRINFCNVLLKNYVTQHSEFILNDSAGYNTIPTSVNSANVTNTLEDSVHLSALGAERAGAGMWNDVFSYMGLPKCKRRPSTVAEAFVNLPNQLFNSVFNVDATTGALSNAGTLSGGATGVVKTSFNLANNTSTSVVGSMPSRADGLGYDQQITWVTSAAAQGWTWSILSAVAGRITEGKRLRCFLEVTFSGCSGMKNLAINLAITYNGLTINLSPTNPTTSSLAMENGDRTVVYEFGHLGYTTPGTCDYTLSVISTSSGAGGGTVLISAPVLYLETI